MITSSDTEEFHQYNGIAMLSHTLKFLVENVNFKHKLDKPRVNVKQTISKEKIGKSNEKLTQSTGGWWRWPKLNGFSFRKDRLNKRSGSQASRYEAKNSSAACFSLTRHLLGPKDQTRSGNCDPAVSWWGQTGRSTELETALQHSLRGAT